MSQFQMHAIRPLLRSCLLAGAAMLLALVAPMSSRAAAPITALYAAPITAASSCNPDGTGAVPSTQAGSRSDFCLAYRVDSPPPEGDDMQREVVDTPLGFAGDPTNRPICTAAEFAADTTANVTCPVAAQIGDGRADLILQIAPGSNLALSGVTGRAFNLEAASDEVARIGIVLDPPGNPKVKILVHITLRPYPNVGLRSTIENLPREVCLTTLNRCDVPIATTSFALRFWGSNIDHPKMPAPFALLGSDCDTDQVTTINATSYDGTPTSAESRYKLTDCATAPFDPALAVSTTETRPDVPTAAKVSATFGTGSGGRVAAAPHTTVVTMPAGLMLGAQVAGGPGGLPLCSVDQFGRTSSAPATCPEASSIGDVHIVSPVLATALDGHAYVGAQSEVGALPDLYVEAALGATADAPRVKLLGKLSVGDDGRLVATLDDLPQVPVSEFTLNFRGGDAAPLVTPFACGASTARMVATATGAAAAKTIESPYAITDDCAGAGGFAPTVGFSTTNPQAGALADFQTSIVRPDRSQRLTRTVIDLPPGQVANLKGVPECAQDVAARGGCDASTRVGSVTALAGVGATPYRVTGAVYLTARSEGAVAGISIHTDVKLGGVDLGGLDVPARIEIRPEDLGLRIVADVPLKFRGLPLDLRQLDVNLDRPGFGLSPTSCAPLTSGSTLTGSGGTVAQVTTGYQVQGCARLPFSPTLEAAITGQTQPNGRPTIQLRIGNPAGSAALKRTFVTLPEGVGVDLKQIPRACPQDTFRAGGCPDTARIGKLNATLSITDDPLAGSVYLLKPAAGSVLPGLGLDFVGRFAGRVVGSNAVDPKTGRIVARFETVPDLPLTSLQIEIAGGTGGPLIATEGLCTQPVSFDGVLDGQNGASVTRASRTVCNAPLGTRLTALTGRMSRLKGGKPILRLRGTGAADRLLTRIDLTLPSGWALASQRGRPGSRYAKISGLSLKSSARATRRSPRRLQLKLPSKGTSKFSLITRTGTIVVKKSADRKTKKTLVITARLTYKDGTHLTVPLLLKPH